MTANLNVLLLCDYHLPGSNANTLADHINSFQKHSQHNIFVLSSVGDLPADFNIDAFDVLVIHYSIVIIGTSYLSEWAKDRIANFKGLKVQYIQDEYREINRFQIEIDRLGIDLLFTCIPSHLWKYTYPDHILPRVTLRPTLTGYVPEHLLSLPAKPIAERNTDVFYRGRDVPLWLGSVAREKCDIANEFISHAAGRALVLDIDSTERSRLYGDEWVRRLGDAKCTLGVESAASLLDFTGGYQRRTDAYLKKHPNATFEEVERKAFPGVDNRFNTAQISPRCFEAAAMRTCMILYEGSYSGILEPNRHYLPLKKDFSNFEEVCAVLTDHERLQEVCDQAYKEVAQNPKYSYKNFVEEFDFYVIEEIKQRDIKLISTQAGVFSDFIGTGVTLAKPEVGRIHGPLYYHAKKSRQLFVSRQYWQNCNADIFTESETHYLGRNEEISDASPSSDSAILLIDKKQLTTKRILLLLWRSIPYRWRLALEPILIKARNLV